MGIDKIKSNRLAIATCIFILSLSSPCFASGAVAFLDDSVVSGKDVPSEAGKGSGAEKVNGPGKDSGTVQGAGKGSKDSMKKPFIDRWAFKTNAFEWLLTIPNFGAEFDLTSSEYNNMTMAITAKYNWNTWHKYTPSTVFNLLDIRPEFRYWYRTRQRPSTAKEDNMQAITFGQKLDSLLTERKNPRTWRAHYIGAYVDYGSYSFKLGKKGIQGHTIGFGASAGYALPLYQYAKGAIDIELGFSVGLQVCTRDVYTHDPDGYYYVRESREEGTRDKFHFTPFPVVSEMRVAFAWRSVSIKDKIKEDPAKITNMKQMNGAIGDVDRAFVDIKAGYDSYLESNFSREERDRIISKDSLYIAGFEVYVDTLEAQTKKQVSQYMVDDDTLKKLDNRIKSRKAQAVKDFLKVAKEPVIAGRRSKTKSKTAE